MEIFLDLWTIRLSHILLKLLIGLNSVNFVHKRPRDRRLSGKFYLLIHLVGGGVQLGPLGTAATDWPIDLRLIMMMENLVEWRLAGETEVLGENPPQCHFVHHKSHLTRPGIEPGPPRWEPRDYLLELWRGPLSGELVPTLGDRGCCVVSATNHNGRYFRFSRPEPLLFHSSSSSIIFTRLSGPRSRPTTSQKRSGSARNRSRANESVARNSDH
jgi:hypothetical protein